MVEAYKMSDIKKVSDYMIDVKRPVTCKEICDKFGMHPKQFQNIINALKSKHNYKIDYIKSYYIHPGQDKIKQSVISEIYEIISSCPDDEFYTNEIADLIDCNECTARHALSDLVKAGKLKKRKDGNISIWSAK